MNSYVYDAFGVVISSSGSIPNFLEYVGRFGYWYETMTGVYLIRARWYDPRMADFLTRTRLILRQEMQICTLTWAIIALT